MHSGISMTTLGPLPGQSFGTNHAPCNCSESTNARVTSGSSSVVQGISLLLRAGSKKLDVGSPTPTLPARMKQTPRVMTNQCEVRVTRHQIHCSQRLRARYVEGVGPLLFLRQRRAPSRPIPHGSEGQ